jgi:putative ABC transport system ATP-binding protein
VTLFGKPLTSYTPADLQHVRAARIGFVFQTFLLLESLTVEENIMIVTSFIRNSCDSIDTRIKELLDQLNIGHLAKKRPDELSQGEKQRVAIARAVINEPDLIIADEPTASVDTVNGSEIIRLLQGFAKNAKTCVLVTSHDMRIVAFADRVLEMEDGRIKPQRPILQTCDNIVTSA